jgi:ABC-2 type transport system ATP-binding protein
MIEMLGLTKRFDEVLAVDEVTLRVQKGEVLGLLGPNGAGKTTTVRMLSAILRPTRGRARVAGYDVVEEAQEVRRRVGMLTESPGLYTRMTGWEYLDFYGRLRDLTTSERESRIDDLADRFRMTPFLDRRLGTYSKGMSQKITLMRTLLHNPSVLLLDEPTSAMDPQSARLVRDMILQLRTEERAIIICTHNLPEAEELADRIAIIRKGAIVATGTLSELKGRLLGPPLIEARFTEPSRNGVAQLVGQFADVEDAGKNWIRYRTANPETINPSVVGALVEAGVSVVSLGEVPRSLESVYLRVVGEA